LAYLIAIDGVYKGNVGSSADVEIDKTDAQAANEPMSLILYAHYQSHAINQHTSNFLRFSL
jgi:hypothetical protein